TMKIWWTSDGGTSWTQAATPSSSGWITSIFMVDRQLGYASLYSQDYSLWQTTDGGRTWTDFTKGNNSPATCVYKTGKALIKTIWENGFQPGGISTDGGATFSQVFSGGLNWSSGIDFSDGTFGVVTMGPDPGFGGQRVSWYSSDAGITWKQSGGLQEAWGVYGLKGTQKFISLPEGDKRNTNQSVFISNDGGKTWIRGFTFAGNPDFTGHIAGVGNTVYVQTYSITTNAGMFRSDDFGQTWVNVGGPSNIRDTRFAVTGCSGETVYAFDDNGGVWKTTDGGDGAFSLTPRIGAIESKKAGDSTLIPIYLDSTAAPFSIGQISGSLTLNSDLLTPTEFVTKGTLSNSITFDTLYFSDSHTVNFSIKYKNPLKNGIAFSTPLIYIRARVYLTTIDTTQVTLSSLDINADSSPRSLTVCSTTANVFSIISECGKPSLQEYMKSGDIPRLMSIKPNPNTSASAEVTVYLPEAGALTVDILDMSGRYIRSRISGGFLNKGVGSIFLDISDLMSGVYTLRLHPDGGSYLTGRLVISR
ncbi:MAG: T9SS type A sorting domain-containing protein, partial [Bacteroidota bacterium]|nr:T9SS type A sorting domain-containing protein [Bacteroidota bacterium]